LLKETVESSKLILNKNKRSLISQEDRQTKCKRN